ncbi:MAG: dual specificity protein phosphatase family protein [Sedimenticola sp.]
MDIKQQPEERCVDSHPFDILPLENGSHLIFTPCPGTKGVDIQTSVQQLKQAGAEAVITMMPEDEMNRFNAATLPQVCQQQSLEWFHMPVEDDSAPASDFHDAWEREKAKIHQLLDQKGDLVIHCRGGSGRTGLMATILLLERGVELEKAVPMVKTLRPNSLKVPSHLEYLANQQQIKSFGG